MGGFIALMIPGIIYSAAVSPPGTPLPDVIMFGIIAAALAVGVLGTIVVVIWWIIKFLGG